MQILHKRVRGLIWLCLLLGLVIGTPALAQDNSVTFTGTVSEVTETTITVGGVPIDISGSVLPVGGVTEGMEVQVIGVADGQVIRATVVLLLDAPEPDTEEPQETEEPETPGEDAPEATPEPQAPPVVVSDAPIIVIEGPVQAINISSITIFDIDIEVDPADPVLTEIRIGDTIRIQGQSSIENNVIVIVAINITIIETTVVVVNNPGTIYVQAGLPANCKRTSKGKVTCKKSSRRS